MRIVFEKMGSSDEALELLLKEVTQRLKREKFLDLKRAVFRLNANDVVTIVAKLPNFPPNIAKALHCQKQNYVETGDKVRNSEGIIALSSPSSFIITAITIPSRTKLPFVHEGEIGTAADHLEKAQAVARFLKLAISLCKMPFSGVLLLLVLVAQFSKSSLFLLLLSFLTASSRPAITQFTPDYNASKHVHVENRLSNFSLSYYSLVIIVNSLIITLLHITRIKLDSEKHTANHKTTATPLSHLPYVNKVLISPTMFRLCQLL